MASDTEPTNAHIVSLLEAMSRRLDELQNAQQQMAVELKRFARTSR